MRWPGRTAARRRSSLEQKRRGEAKTRRRNCALCHGGGVAAQGTRKEVKPYIRTRERMIPTLLNWTRAWDTVDGITAGTARHGTARTWCGIMASLRRGIILTFDGVGFCLCTCSSAYAYVESEKKNYKCAQGRFPMHMLLFLTLPFFFPLRNACLCCPRRGKIMVGCIRATLGFVVLCVLDRVKSCAHACWTLGLHV
jgi:hypothetical protein